MSQHFLKIASPLVYLILLATVSNALAGNSILVSEVPEICPATQAEWLTKRESLRHSAKVTDAFALGELFSRCSQPKATKQAMHEPTSEPKLKSCFKGLTDLSQLLERREDDWITLENVNRLRDPAKLKLPSMFQSAEFWSAISSGDVKKIRSRLTLLAQTNAGLFTIKYLSHLQPKLPVYVSILDLPDFLWLIDYDTDLNINVFVEQKAKPNQSTHPQRALVGLSREDLTELPSGVAVAGSKLQGKLQRPLSEQGGRCYQCHQTPVLAIAPLDLKSVMSFGSLKDANEAVHWFNRTYAQRTDEFPTKQLSFLPAFGDLNASEAKALQESCWPEAKGLQKIRAQEAMQCARCHSEKGIMPALKIPFGPFGRLSERVVEWDLQVHPELGVSPKIISLAAIPQMFLTEGHMPPDFDEALNRTEREKLFQCLLQDYFGSMLGSSEQSKQEGRFIHHLLLKSCRN